MGWIGNIITRANRASINSVTKHGSQKTFDREAIKITIGNQYGVRQPQDLHAYRKLYLGHWLARRMVNSLVGLTLSDVVPCSENQDLDKRVAEFIRKIELKQHLRRMLAQFFCYGATYSETCFDAPEGPTEITHLHTVDSRSMRVDLDPYGFVRQFIQLPQEVGIVQGTPGPIYIDPDRMIHLVFSPLGDSIYGQSILLAILPLLNSISVIEKAMTKSAIRATMLQDLVNYIPAEGEDQTEAEEALTAMVASYEKSQPGDPLFTIGEWQRQGPSATNPTKMSIEWETLVQAAIAGGDLTSDAVGIGFSNSLHEAAEQRVVLISLIESIQSQIVEALNEKLFRPLADLWNSDEITVEMASPILLSEKERAEKTTIDINNAGIKAKMGVLTGQQVAQELGYDELADEDRFSQWLESGQTLQDSRNPNDRNTTQQDSKTIKDNKVQEKKSNE